MSTEDRAETAVRADRADRAEAATTAIHRKLRLTELSGLVAAVFGLMVFAYLTVPAVDSDYGWHVANGRHLLDGQLFAGVDTYSWTAAGATSGRGAGPAATPVETATAMAASAEAVVAVAR